MRIVDGYPHAPAKVWRALTDPDVIPRWTATGRGGRPVGFSPIVGRKFQFVARPMPGWSGVVQCEVLEAEAPTYLRYSWVGDEGGDVTHVTYRLEPVGPATRFTWEHTGFRGIGGFFMARILGSVRRTMLGEGLPAVLDELEG
jgi:uncharacterized protein YndB with AHSA1/START domain